MPHDITLIATVAAAFGLALLFGLLAAKLRMPPLVGYLLAGIIIGPATPGFVADMGLAGQLAEIGVMLLMFGVGLHFSLDDLLAVKRIAIPGAMVQITVATICGAALAAFWGWPLGAAMVFGLSLSVASTVVLLRALENRGVLQSMNGQIAVGWLVVEDLVMVLVLVLLPAFAPALPGSGGAAASGSLFTTVAITLVKVAGFIVVMVVGGRRILPRLLWWVANTGSQELFRLAVVAVAIGIAFGAAKLFDVSFALGAFFAGMMLRESEFSHRAADESLPLRDAFAVLFFVSVGMLFDPAVIWQQPGKLIAVLSIILLVKTLAAIGLVLAFRYPLSTALIVGASLAQIGEFSFILAGLGVAQGLLSREAQSLILAGAFVSIAANSALFAAVEPLRAWALRRSAWARKLDTREDPLAALPMSTDAALLAGQVVLVGSGRVGREIATRLRAAGVPLVIADRNRERVDALRAEGFAAVSGDAADPIVLVQAHVARAGVMVIAVPGAVGARAMIDTARTLNPAIRIAVRVSGEEEAALFGGQPGVEAFVAERALGVTMAERVQHWRGAATSGAAH